MIHFPIPLDDEIDRDYIEELLYDLTDNGCEYEYDGEIITVSKIEGRPKTFKTFSINIDCKNLLVILDKKDAISLVKHM